MAAVLLILLLVLVGLLVWAIATYNSLVSLRRQTDNSFGQIDVQLKRRYDLIPNLVETVKGYMKHERETLDAVIRARNSAVSATGVADKAAAESQVQRALSGVFALSEAYPELRSNENMRALQEELSATENKVAFARQYYNDVVTQYNTKIESFPGSLIAGMGSFKEKELFEIDTPAERQAVKVQF
jgi:LemA protein